MKDLFCSALRLAVVLLIFSAAWGPAVAESGLYLRGGVGLDWSSDTSFRDNDCASQQPPALFGCGAGEDGRPLAARGDFGALAGFEGGVGVRLLPFLRAEALLMHRPEFEFTGEANFLRTPGAQPVSAEVTSTTGMLVGFVDLVGLGFPALGPVEPYFGAGLGFSRHRIGRVDYSFPGLGPNAATEIQGGASTSLTHMLTAGAAIRVTKRLLLDIGYRYLDLGEVRTEAGPATITRPNFSRVLDIDETEADLTTHGISTTIRFQF